VFSKGSIYPVSVMLVIKEWKKTKHLQ